jgi:hypothetical protein
MARRPLRETGTTFRTMRRQTLDRREGACDRESIQTVFSAIDAAPQGL